MLNQNGADFRIYSHVKKSSGKSQIAYSTKSKAENVAVDMAKKYGKSFEFCHLIDNGHFYIACAMGLHRTDIALCTYWVFYAADKGIVPPEIREMKTDMVRIVSIEDKFYIHGIAELEGCHCYSWGENLLHVSDNEYGEYLVNQVTGKVRKIVERGKLVGFLDEEIDFEAIDKLDNSHNAHTRSIDYAGINRWMNCKNGLIALSWMLYPDGRYFADEDGFGMEDNDEVKVYCVMNENLEVVRPFAPVEDVAKLLERLSLERTQNI